MPGLPPTPVVEQIAADIVDSLSAVKVVAGYHCDLIPTRPAPHLGNVLENGTAIVFAGDRVREFDAPQQYEQWLQTFTIRCNVVEADGSERSIDAVLQMVAGDVLRAMTKDEATRRRGGWAIDTIATAVSPLPRTYDSNEGMIDVEVQVQFRHTLGNPFECPFRTP
jgi:hypothetical protein